MGGGHGNPLQYSCLENPQVGCSPWGDRELDMTERLSTAQHIVSEYIWCEYRLSHLFLSPTPWTVARQAPLCMEFPRQDYWSGFPCPPPNPGIEPSSPAPPALIGVFLTSSATDEAWIYII